MEKLESNVLPNESKNASLPSIWLGSSVLVCYWKSTPAFDNTVKSNFHRAERNSPEYGELGVAWYLDPRKITYRAARYCITDMEYK